MSSQAPRWNTTERISKVKLTQIFSGGACNILDEDGILQRNTERDAINDWLNEHKIIFFDPQIHPDTHGEEYNYIKHYRLEVGARKSAMIRLYEVSPRTFGGITSLEIAADSHQWREPMVIYFSDGNAGQDHIPQHSPEGHPLFIPYNLFDSRIMTYHYNEFRKNGNNMRKYLVRFAQEIPTLTIAYEETPQPGDINITPLRMHASRMFEAVIKSVGGEVVVVNFTGGAEAKDEQGNPLFLLPENPTEMEMKVLLDQYVDEGNQLRKMMAKLLIATVYLRIAYTQKSAIFSLEELMKIKGMLNENL